MNQASGDGGGTNEARLEKALASLEATKSWSPRVVSKLEGLIRNGPEDSLFRINPIRYADTYGVAESEALDLFLHAANFGLFDMDWLLVCGACSNVFTSFRRLASLDPHFVCSLCGFVNEADLDDYIHVTFTISPRIRRLRFHDPESLDVDELYFRYHFSQDGKPLSHGRTVAETLRQWTRLLCYLEPGETRSIELELPHSLLGIWDVISPSNAMFVVEPEPGDHTSELALELEGGRFAAVGDELVPASFELPEGASYYMAGSAEPAVTAENPDNDDKRSLTFSFPAIGHLPAGPVTLTIRNTGNARASAWVVQYPPVPDQAAFVEFLPVLTAKKALSNQTFRSLFRSETAPESERLKVRDLTYLFTDLQDSTLMYDMVGDVNAYDLVRRHFDALVVAVAANNGSITKTIGDAIMATFISPADAVQAALDMHAAIEEINRSVTADVIIKIGIHRGQSLAVTLNDRIDYFGQDVNIAARVQQLAKGGEIMVSADVYRSLRVTDLLADFEPTEEDGIMKGVGEMIPVYRARVLDTGIVRGNGD